MRSPDPAAAPVKVGRFTVRPHVRAGVMTGKWQVDVPADLSETGQRLRLSFSSREEAVLGARERRELLRTAGYVPTRASEAPSYTVQELVDVWLAAQQVRVEAKKKRFSSYEANYYQLKSVCRAMGDVALVDLKRDTLERYQADRTAAKIRPETINSELATFYQVQTYGVEEGLHRRLVAVDRVPLRPREVVVFTPAEVRRFIRCVPEHCRPLVRFLAETGCRFGEATNLQWRHVDLSAGIAKITADDDWSPKSRFSIRPLRLSAALCRILLPSKGNDLDYVFHGRGGPDTVLDDIRRSMRKASERAQIKRDGKVVIVRPKDLRSAFATAVAVRGTREVVMQGMLGHAPGSRVTKRHYEHSTVGEAITAAEAHWGDLGPG